MKNLYGSNIIGIYLNDLLVYTFLFTISTLKIKTNRLRMRMDVLNYTEVARTNYF
jgi:succinate-acetate transporter protein